MSEQINVWKAFPPHNYTRYAISQLGEKTAIMIWFLIIFIIRKGRENGQTDVIYLPNVISLKTE